MDDDLIVEMMQEDNSEYDEVEFVSDVTNEFGNIDEKKEYVAYVPMDSQTRDYRIINQIEF